MLSPQAKICGLSTLEHALLAAESGAGMLGFVHFPRSPRHLEPAAVAPIAAALRARHPYLPLVAVTVDPEDALVDRIMAAYRPDYLQLHGQESPERCLALRARAGTKIIKAVPVASLSDLADAEAYSDAADMLMLDAKPTGNDTLPGGNGRTFDWNILAAAQRPTTLPWMLSGGLTPENLTQAMARTGAPWVDVSSGVEYEPGKKDPARIQAFLKAVCQL